MKKLVSLLCIASSYALAAPVDINKSLELAKAANPKAAAAIGQSQTAWLAWASDDCMARSGAQTANLNDLRFNICFSEQIIRRAEQLSQYACGIDQKLCAK